MDGKHISLLDNSFKIGTVFTYKTLLMKKNVFVLILILVNFAISNAQNARGARIAYIDMEYILQNIPDFAEANNQLELKAQAWKQELDVKQNEILRLKEALKTEKVLLTKELIEEREEAIAFLEKEYSDFQQKKFGPTGDLVVQKQVLVKPIQDQVFTAVQELAEANKYDFILDKSSDLTLLFADKKWNLSERVIRKMTRTTRISKMTKKEIKADDAKDFQDDLEAANPDIANKRKTQEDRKAALNKKREDIVAAKMIAKEAADAKRKETTQAKLATKTAVNTVRKDSVKSLNDNTKTKLAEDRAIIIAKNISDKEALRLQNLTNKTKTFEERKKANEERIKKTLAKRDSLIKARANKIIPKKE